MNIDWELSGMIIWGIGIISWGIIRFRPNVKSRKTTITTTKRPLKERFSMLISQMGLGILPAIWVFTGFPQSLDRTTYPAAVIIGALIFIVSLWLFRKTHKALGKMWSHSLDLREDHKLVTSGIYQHVRHPMYTAFWMWAFAQPFLLSNWFAGFAGIVGFGTLFFLRVGQEEEMMRGEFGSEYDDYVNRTKRVFPSIY